ncbi:MAG: DUF6782 family putative metallopeptidase [Pseudomonadota bacterium]
MARHTYLTASSTLALMLAACGVPSSDRVPPLGSQMDPQTKQVKSLAGSKDQPNDVDAQIGFGTRDVKAWRRQRAEACLGPDEAPTSVTEAMLAGIRDPIMKTDLGQRLAADVAGHDSTLCTAQAMPLKDGKFGGVYKVHYRAMAVNDTVPTGQQILHAAHEWRHAWHDVQGFFTPDIEHNQQHHSAKVFMIEADARAFATAVAWQLREQGDNRAWEAALAIKTYRPIAQAFAQKMTTLTVLGDPPITRSDAALRAAMGVAYRTWFADGDMARPYAQQLVERAAGYAFSGQSWPGARALRYEEVVGIGRLPGQASSDRESYIQPADVTLAVDDAYQRMSPKDERVPVQGLPQPVVGRKAAPTPGKG